jgi:hypothetical protein
MADEVFCTECKRELTGALEVIETIVGKHVSTVHRETADCNWRRCRGCGRIVCKACDYSQRYFCCGEGMIVTRERAAANLTFDRDRSRQTDVGGSIWQHSRSFT